MMSSAEEAEPGPSCARVAIPVRPVEPAGLRIETTFYLVSVCLIAAATFGASLGIGFYMLSHPPEEAAVEPARSSGAELGAAAPISGAADESRSAAVTGSAATDTELSTRDKSAAASQPENTPPASEASASIPSEPSQGRSGEDTSGSLREAAHLTVQDIAPDTNPPPVEGERPDQDRQQVGELSNSPEIVNGPVTDVRDVTTWVVDGHTVRLFGIGPHPRKLLASLVNWVRAKGAVEWNTSPASEASASIPSEPSQGRSGEDTSGSLQEAAHLVTQDVVPDPPPYLLLHPPEEAAAEPARSSGAQPGAAAPISG